MNIFQRINAVMADVKGVEKTEVNKQGGGYKYAGHEALTAALRGAYVKHGIVRSASIVEAKRDGGNLALEVEVAFINIEKPEDRHVVRSFGESPNMSSKGSASPVQVGIALSYAVKNAEFKLFAVTGDDTPDAEEADRSRGEIEAMADMLIDRYELSETRADVDAVTADVRKSWDRLRPFAGDLRAAREKAEKRFA